MTLTRRPKRPVFPLLFPHPQETVEEHRKPLPTLLFLTVSSSSTHRSTHFFPFLFPHPQEMVEEHRVNLMLPKLVALNSPHFDMDECNFSRKNMTAIDK